MSAGFFPTKKKDVESFIRIAQKVYNTKEFKKVKHLITQAVKNGRILARYKGWADCRICKKRLADHDIGVNGQTLPGRWEHYIIVHKMAPIEWRGRHGNKVKYNLSFIRSFNHEEAVEQRPLLKIKPRPKKDVKRKGVKK